MASLFSLDWVIVIPEY